MCRGIGVAVAHIDRTVQHFPPRALDGGVGEGGAEGFPNHFPINVVSGGVFGVCPIVFAVWAGGSHNLVREVSGEIFDGE